MKKIISVLLTAGILCSMAGCSKEPAPEETGAGEYTYTLYEGTGYEMTLSMDVDVDDYISAESDGQKYFCLPQLAFDLDWLASDQFSAFDDDDELSYCSNFYYFHDGDFCARIEINRYTDEFLPGSESPQIWLAAVSYHNDDGDETRAYYTPEDAASAPSHRTTRIMFDKHYDDCGYRLTGLGWHMSYDDIVLLSYLLWAESENPGSSSMVGLVGTDADYCTAFDHEVDYYLP